MCFGCVECSLFLNQTVKTLHDDEINISIEIVKNYIHKYISNGQVFLSITSCATNDEQKYLQQTLINKLVRHSKMEKVSYNLLSKIHQFRRKNTNIFNLILIDGIDSLT